jgi:hypothetical protein
VTVAVVVGVAVDEGSDELDGVADGTTVSV